MVDVINIFLQAFSGVVSGFTSLEFGGYSFGSLLLGGFVVGTVITFVISRIIRR